MAAPPFVAYLTLTMANHKVLIVDDSSATRKRLRELLPKGNYEIREAGDGDAGWALIEQERHHVRFILLGSQVSQPSAWEIVQQLQGDRDLYKVPLVLMTPDKPAALAQLALPPDACEVLETPFEKRQLQKAIKAAIAKAKAALPPPPVAPQDTYVPLPGLVSGPGTIDVEDWENAAAAPLAAAPAPQPPSRDEADRDELAALAQAALAADEADPDRSEDFLLASSGLPAFLSGDELANLPVSRDIPLEEIDQQLAELGMPSGILDTSFDDDTLAPGDPFAVPPPEPERPLAPAASDEATAEPNLEPAIGDEAAIPTELTAEAEQLWEEARDLASDWPDPAADVTLSEAIAPEREDEPKSETASAAALEESTVIFDERGIAADSEDYQFDFDSDFESDEPAAPDASEPTPANLATWVQDDRPASEAEPELDLDPLATVQQAEAEEATALPEALERPAAEDSPQLENEFSENAGEAEVAATSAAPGLGWAISQQEGFADASEAESEALAAADALTPMEPEATFDIDDLPVEEAIARDDFFASPESLAPDDRRGRSNDPFALPPDFDSLSPDAATTEERVAESEATPTLDHAGEDDWAFEDPFATEVPDTLLPSLDEIADPFAELASQENDLDRPKFAAAEPLPGEAWEPQELPAEAWPDLEEVADPTTEDAAALQRETSWLAADPETAQEAWAEEAALLAAETPEAAGEDLAAATETVAWNAEAASEATVAWSEPDLEATDAPLAADREAAAEETVAWSESEARLAAEEAERLAAELSSDETALEVGGPLSTSAPSVATSAANLNFQFDPDELADDDEYDDDHTVIEDRREVTTETVFATPATESVPAGLRLPEGAVTLGGFDDVLMRFHSQIEVERLSALRDALKCGKPGCELLLQAIKTETGAIQAEAERLVLERLQATPLAYHIPEAERWLRLECVQILRGHSHWVQDVAIAPNGRTLVSGSKDGTLKLWDLLTGRELMTLHGHTSAVLSVALSPDGKQIASSSSDNTIRIWDCETGRQVRAIQGNRGHPIYVIAVSPDGERIISASADSNVKPKFDFSIDALLSRLPAETKSPLISTLKLLCRTQAIRVWNLASGKPEGTLVGYSRGLTDLRVSPDGELVIAGSRDQTIQIWEFKTGQLRSTLLGHTDEIRSVALSPDGRSLVSGSRDRTIKIWDLRTGHVLRTLRGHAQSVTSVAIGPDGQVVVSGSRDGTVRIWDFHTGQHLHTLFGHADLVRAIAISADGNTIVSGSRDRTVRVWQSVVSG